MKYLVVTGCVCFLITMAYDVLADYNNNNNSNSNNNNVQRLLSKKKVYHAATPGNSYNTMHNKKNQKQQVYQSQRPIEQLTTMSYNTLNTEQYGFNQGLNYRSQQQQQLQQQQQYSMQQQSNQQQQQQQQYSMQQMQQQPPMQISQQQFRKRDLNKTVSKIGLCPDPKSNEYDFVCGLFQCENDRSCLGVEKCVNYYFRIYCLAKLTCLFLFYLVFDFVWRPYLHEAGGRKKQKTDAARAKLNHRLKFCFTDDLEKLI